MNLHLDGGVPALVAKIGHYPLHYGGVGAIRSLGRAGVPVFAITEDRHVPAAYSRWLTGMFVWPNGDLGPAALLDGFVEIVQRIGGRPVVVPTDDRTAVFLAEHAAALRPFCRIPDQPPEVARSVASKLGLARACAEFGVPTPRICLPSEHAEARGFCCEVGFPVVAKATEPWRQAGATLPSTSILRSFDELRSLWDANCAGGGSALLLQEFVADGEDWIVHGYCNHESEAVAIHTGVKLRSFPAYAGATSLARVQDNPVLQCQARALFRKLGYRGIMDMDWRLDHRDGLYKLLDFNPRVGSQFRMFVDEHDLDVVRAQHLDLSGRPVPRGQATDGRAFVVEHMDVMAGLGEYRRSGLAPRDWYRSVRQVDESGWFSADDLGPTGVFAARFATRVASRARRRVWKREPSPTIMTARQRRPRFYPGRLDPAGSFHGSTPPESTTSAG